MPGKLLVLLLLACSTAAGQGVASGQGNYPPGIELPPGQHRELVLRVCTRCHDLKGLSAYKGYWNRSQWLAMVNTMSKHGAALGAGQAAGIADYLQEHFGRPDLQNRGK